MKKFVLFAAASMLTFAMASAQESVKKDNVKKEAPKTAQTHCGKACSRLDNNECVEANQQKQKETPQTTQVQPAPKPHKGCSHKCKPHAQVTANREVSVAQDEPEKK